MVAIFGQDCFWFFASFFRFPTLFCLPIPFFFRFFHSVSSCFRKMTDVLQMERTSSQELTDPSPPALPPAMELRLFVALSPLRFAMLTDRRPILPGPYSLRRLRFGLRTDPLKAFERAHYFMSWSAPYAEPPPRHSIKKYMLCSIVFTPQGVLTLLLANILEKGDGHRP